MYMKLKSIGVLALFAASIFGPSFADFAEAAGRKAHRAQKASLKHRKKLAVKKTVNKRTVMPVDMMAGAVLRDPNDPCPAPGHVGIFTAAEYQSVISNNLKMDIDICADLEFAPGDQADIRGGFSGLPGMPGDYTYGFQGRLHGRGHTIRPSLASDPSQQRSISLGFETIYNATIEDLTLEVPGQGVGAGMPASFLIGYYANNVSIRNLTLKNVTTASGLFSDQSRNLSFHNIRGDITLRSFRNTSYIGALAATCQNCEVSGSNLRVSLDYSRQLPLSATTSRPTYAGGLFGVSFYGFIHVRDTVITAQLNTGYDRGAIIGAINGEPSENSGGSPQPAPELIVENVRIINSDLSLVPGAVSYTAGAVAGRASSATRISRTLVRDTTISANSQAGGLVGGGHGIVDRTALENVTVRAGDVVGGMIGLSGGARVSDSYFRGEVNQDTQLSIPYLGSGLRSVGGILGITLGFPGSPDGWLSRVYVRGAVLAADPLTAGALIGSPNGEPDTVGEVQSAYYDNSLASQSGGIGTGLTPAQMLMPASFVGFDTSVWNLREGRLPSLHEVRSFTLQDLFDFLGNYLSNNSSADLDGSGTVTVMDLFIFLEMYFG